MNLVIFAEFTIHVNMEDDSIPFYIDLYNYRWHSENTGAVNES